MLHIPPLPENIYQFYFATSDIDESANRFSSASYTRRFLNVRVNDTKVWQRSIAPYHAITRCVLPPPTFKKEGNLITLENLGVQPIALDALWIEAHRPPNQPFYVALDQGHWLNREASAWIKTAKVDVAPPPHREYPDQSRRRAFSLWPTDREQLQQYQHLPPTPELPEEKRTPVNSLTELQTAWEALHSHYGTLTKLDHPHLPVLDKWIPPLQAVVERGMFPLVHLKYPDTSPYSLEAAAFLFGDLVQTWILPEYGTPDAYDRQLRDRIPQAKVESPLKKVSQHRSIRTLVTQPFWQGYQLTIDDNKYRFQELASEGIFSYKHPPFTMSPVARQFYLPQQHAYKNGYMATNSTWAFHSVAERLMRTDFPVIIKGGYPGGPFFPDGSDRPSDFWKFLRPMFRFGSPHHHSGIANIHQIGDSANPVFLDWGVADNQTDSVDVLVYAAADLPTARARMEVAVPWSGPTEILEHSTDWSMKVGAAPQQRSSRLSLNAIPLANVGSHPAKGWIAHEFAMKGMHVFELRPADKPLERANHAPPEIGFAHLKPSHTLFNTRGGPPPPWWSRKEMTDRFHIKWFATGPVRLEPKVDASRGGTPGWDTMKGIHKPIPKEYETVAPRSNISTRFHFKTGQTKQPQSMRMFFNPHTASQAQAVGVWVRAHRPPGFEREVDPFHAVPQARFYMGKLPVRQKIEIPYDSWQFISSPALYWETSSTDYPPALMFWPVERLPFQPILEINSFAAYQLNLPEGLQQSGQTLGFVRKQKDGTLTFLIVGTPGERGYWLQRIEQQTQAERVKHVKDITLIVSADSPEAPPPEQVVHTINWQEEAQVLEFTVPKMPDRPSTHYSRMIQERFPLIGREVKSQNLSAVLFEEVNQSNATDP